MHLKIIPFFLMPLAIQVSAAPQAGRKAAAISTSTRIVTKVEPNTSIVTVDCLESGYKAFVPTVVAAEASMATNINNQVVIVTSTTTLTAPVATSAVAKGLNFKIHQHRFDASQVNNNFTSTAEDFKGPLVGVYGSGRINTLSFRQATGADLTLPMSNNYPPFGGFQGASLALMFRGFFKALETGNYTLSTDANKNDNWAYLWVGDVALEDDWDDTNTVYQAKRVTRPFIGGSYSIAMNQGDVVPIRYLWANGGGPGVSDFTITSPSGITTTNGTSHFVLKCYG